MTGLHLHLYLGAGCGRLPLWRPLAAGIVRYVPGCTYTATV